jgi:hypothetical protein
MKRMWIVEVLKKDGQKTLKAFKVFVENELEPRVESYSLEGLGGALEAAWELGEETFEEPFDIVLHLRPGHRRW